MELLFRSDYKCSIVNLFQISLNMNSEDLILAIHQIVNPVISLIGCIFCLSSLIVFWNSAFNKKFFTHIKIEIIFMLLTLSIVVLQPIYYQKPHYNNYFSQMYYVYFIRYAKAVTESVVLFSNIFSDIRFLAFITNYQLPRINCENHALKGYSSLWLTAAVVAFNSVSFSYNILKFNILSENCSVSSNSSHQVWNVTESIKTPLVVVETVAICFRDGLGVVLLVTMNATLFFKVIFFEFLSNGCKGTNFK
jgi:hypothetical protein